MEDSDHHMYFDNPKHFLELILEDLKDYIPEAKKSDKDLDRTDPENLTENFLLEDGRKKEENPSF